MACALGLTDQLVGITHECDYPPAIGGTQIVVRTALRLEGKSPGEIDAAVSARLGEGGSLYELDQGLLERLSPTHILAQNLCQVCAPSGRDITRALQALPSKPQILWFSPHSLADIEENIRELGRATGRLLQAEKLVAATRIRLQRLGQIVVRSSKLPRVLCLEWIDPYYSCGHWVPEMVEIAGGRDVLGSKHADSVRLDWVRIAAQSPEVLIVMPCGFDTQNAAQQAIQLHRQPGWNALPAVRDGRVFAVNANAYFARPGPRIIDGIELLAHLIHPDICAWEGRDDAFMKVT